MVCHTVLVLEIHIEVE